MISMDKKDLQDISFIQSLVYIIVDNYNAIISKVPEDLDRKLFEFADNIYNILFSLLTEKILYYCNKERITVISLCILYFISNK